MTHIYEERQKQKELRKRYREIAKQQYLAPEDECAISVADHAEIKVMSDGAFVEATIWVPLLKDTK